MTTLLAFARAVEARDLYSAGHAARVTVVAEGIGSFLGWAAERLHVLRMGAALHDIGKAAIPLDVLRKPAPLDEAELALIRKHPTAGAQMIELIKPLRAAIPAILHHHERWDGLGYPFGRTGNGIPVEARVLAVADAFDAMTSDRPYRPALSSEAAVEELERCAGSQFDPEIVSAFLEAWEAGAFATMTPVPQATL